MRAAFFLVVGLFAAAGSCRISGIRRDNGRVTPLWSSRKTTQEPVNAGARGDNSGRGHSWTAQEQDERVCDAKSRQFTGRVNVTDDKSLFFWFFESTEQAMNKPVIIWLDGGHGASSMAGLFGAAGPCLLHPNAKSTYHNAHSWTNHANMLFIDQPAGVGLSTSTHPESLPTDLSEASKDFKAILDTIFNDIFPQFRYSPLILAGQSEGGAYVPRYASDLQKRNASQRHGSSLEISGVILLNAAVSNTYMTSGHYDLFCEDGGSPLRFNDATCTAMEAAIPECERLQKVCETTLEESSCLAAQEFCVNNVASYFNREVESHKHSPYDLRKKCPDPPICGGGADGLTGSPSAYLGRRKIQDRLGFETNVDDADVNLDLKKRAAKSSALVSHTSELASLLNNGIAVLVVNGNLDVSVNTPGTIRTYDNLPWNNQGEFRQRQFEPWKWTDAKGDELVGGRYKAVPGLDIYTVNDAGHRAAADQREAVSNVVKRWLGEVEWVESWQLTL